jgi:tRNA-modifying protein YgfZ
MNQAAYQALREGAAWIDLSGRAKIRAHGEDRVRLIHAMTTNHVSQLAPGQGCYAFFLNPQGRILADVNLFVLPEYLLLDMEPEVRVKIYEHLDKFIIADDVALEDVTDETATVNVEGPKSESVLTSIGAPIPVGNLGIEAWGDGFVARISSTGAAGFSLFVPISQKADLIGKLEAAGAVASDAESAEVVRLEHWLPKYGVEILESYIPQEVQRLDAIHFNKGCYVGQEIVERVRSRGHLNKMLMRLKIETDQPVARGARVLAGDKDLGEVKSAAFSPALDKTLALVMLRVDAKEKELTVNGAHAALIESV